jgi:iron uptake system EfeUOB component EfeO/EfeM
MSAVHRHIVLVAVVVAAAAAVIGLGAANAHASAHAGRERACSSYPAPGQVAPPTARVPKAIRDSYRVFVSRRVAKDALNLSKLQSPLRASGIIRSGIRDLGRTAAGHKIYAIPARHFTPYKIAPMRCIRPGQRALEASLLPELRRDYKHAAICIVETGKNTFYGAQLENCGPPENIANAMIAASGLPLAGIAPNSVHKVQATYLADPARSISVHHNFYEISGNRDAVKPCAVAWLQPSGNTPKTFEGCDYEAAEQSEYNAYQTFVSSQISTVQSDVNELASAIASGSQLDAESAWLTAHLAWLRIGQDDKQYGAFGNLGNDIDGTSAGLVGGVTSSQFEGFHKIELDLWTDGSLSAAATDTTKLQQLIQELIATPLSSELPVTIQGVANWLLRPHEIIEDAIRDTLTGEDDYGSGTAGASIIADVSAVREDLSLLNPTLSPLAPRLLPQIDRELDAIDTAANAAYTDGGWVGIAALPLAQREKLDAVVSAAAETLSRVPDLLTSTGKASPPT